MARLSVNLNKIALLRNSRHTGVPDILEFAKIAIAAGVAGITIHPRPDQRHIRSDDVPALVRFLRSWRPKIEFNIEGYPDARFFKIAASARPEQCTLVPDATTSFTSEKGWDLKGKQMSTVKVAVRKLKRLGTRVIVFVDPDPTVVERVLQTGADGIEIYTGSYATAFRKGNHVSLLNKCVETARRAKASNLYVNIGHDLNLHNLSPIVRGIPNLDEASIGHELTADALRIGFASAIHAYSAALGSTAPGRDEKRSSSDPFGQFNEWFSQATTSGIEAPNAMTLSTVSKNRTPSSRTVLLKEWDKKGFVFYTNYASKKGKDLAANPHAALLFHWKELERQVRITGKVRKIPQAKSASYFSSRSRESQLSALASAQSTEIKSLAELKDRIEALRVEYRNKKIPLPPQWGGFSVEPSEFEFWQAGNNRLHDRVRYSRTKGKWIQSRLSP